MIARPAARALLFDLDGTLVDSVADLAAAANRLRSRYGLPALAEATLAGFVGDGARRLLERTLADSPEPVGLEEALRAFRDDYARHCLERTLPYPGVIEGLARLAGRPMAIVSNKPEPMCETIAAGLGLDRWIDVVVGARPRTPLKPDPALLAIAIERLGTGPADRGIWMVGDSPNDVRAAKAIGCTSVAVGWGLGEATTLLALGPDLFVEEFDQLVEAAG